MQRRTSDGTHRDRVPLADACPLSTRWAVSARVEAGRAVVAGVPRPYTGDAKRGGAGRRFGEEREDSMTDRSRGRYRFPGTTDAVVSRRVVVRGGAGAGLALAGFAAGRLPLVAQDATRGEPGEGESR